MSKPVSKSTLYMRAYRARKKAERLAAEIKTEALEAIPAATHYAGDDIDEMVKWAAEKLVVPPGHKNSGQPLILPDFSIRFLRDAVSHRESGLFVARKNAKSAICAVYLLARLVGPLKFSGWRGGICSVNKEKATELKQQIIDIAKASGIQGLKIFKSPAPGGRIETDTGGLQILAADKTAGHASGFDDVLFDELGLLNERHRSLVNGLRTSTSAKDGRFIAISIVGDAPFTQEMIERSDEKDTAIHLYQAEANAQIDDETAWAASNPGIEAGIKSLEYMRSEARRVLFTPADQSHFRAFDMNMPQDPDRIMIVSASDWMTHSAQSAMPLGDPVMGIDIGGSSSMTCAVAYWPESGAVKCWGAFGDTPSIKERAVMDGMGNKYQRMIDDGELKIMPGRVTPVDEFIKWVFDTVSGKVQVIAADRYRKAEVEEAFGKADITGIPIQWRGQGMGHNADGSRDVLSFQRLCLGGRLNAGRSLMLEAAILDSSVVMDAAGNQKINRARARGRIDALQAGVLAAGLGERAINRENLSRGLDYAVAG